MSEQKKIKKFSDFMKSSEFQNFLGKLIIEGSMKTWSLGRQKKFKLEIFYTPVRRIIMNIKIYTDDLSQQDLNLTFKKGDTINLALDWSKKNGYEYTDIPRNEFNI